MKVGLLSFHNAYNFGAALQAYALQRTISDMNVECEYINYVNQSRSEEYDMLAQIKRELNKKNYVRVAKLMCGIPFMSLRKRNFNVFYKNNIKKTHKIYKTSAEAKVLNAFYDKFIIGSDQVWNPENNGGDAAFLLDFVDENEKKISYSSSFGASTIPEQYAEVYSENLKSFYRLSTRETAGVNLIKELTGRNAHLVLDPVFLLNKDVWLEMIKDVNCTSSNYIFFYTNRRYQIDDFFSVGYPTDKLFYHILSSQVSVADFLDFKKKVKFSMSPEMFLTEIFNARLVVTASFHCLAFAIIFHKPFVAILTGDRGKDERILNLLRICGLEDRVLDRNTTVEQISVEIDYEEVDRRLSNYRSISLEFLRNAIFDKDDIGFDCNNIVSRSKRLCHGDKCTGCGVCSLICPQEAINMQEDKEGFLMPVIDEEKCSSCMLCAKNCPNNDFDYKLKSQQRYFGLKNKKDVRMISSSGGAFSAISEMVIKNNGVICAATMNDSFVVKHTFAETEDAIKDMRGTFYVQSDLGDSFSEIKSFLKSGRIVMFVGTPCQVNGLKSYLNHNYENLILVDILCHGVPSPAVFRLYIDFLKKKGELSDYRFRDKTLGWGGYTVSAIINNKRVYNKLWLQSYNNLFSHNLINRKSCASCNYSNYNRTGDVTIGDFWHLKKADETFFDDLGVSLVIVNTTKGANLISQLSDVDIKEYEKKNTVQNSLTKPSGMGSNRRKVMSLIRDGKYEKCIRLYAEVNLYGFIKNIIRKFM